MPPPPPGGSSTQPFSSFPRLPGAALKRARCVLFFGSSSCDSPRATPGSSTPGAQRQQPPPSPLPRLPSGGRAEPEKLGLSLSSASAHPPPSLCLPGPRDTCPLWPRRRWCPVGLLPAPHTHAPRPGGGSITMAGTHCARHRARVPSPFTQ